MVGIGEIEHAHGDHADSTGSTCCELTPALHRKGPVWYIINRRLKPSCEAANFVQNTLPARPPPNIRSAWVAGKSCRSLMLGGGAREGGEALQTRHV